MRRKLLIDKQQLLSILLQQQFKDRYKAEFYLKRYVNFIVSRSGRNLAYQATVNNTERHHIIPAKWGGNNDESNMIVLTIAEHVVAHHILARTTNREMIFAFNQIINRSVSYFNYNVSLRLVEEARKSYLLQICKPVVNLNTGEVYSSASIAARSLGYANNSISNACQHHTRINNHYWEYVCNMSSLDEETRLATIKQIQDNYKAIRKQYSDTRKKQVIELDTGKIHASAIDAARFYNTQRTYITKSARCHSKHCGHYWAYVQNVPDYTLEKGLEMCRQREQLINANRQNAVQNAIIGVVNLTTGEIFNNSAEAAIATDRSVSAIRNAARFHTRIADCYWAYERDLDDLQPQTIKLKLEEAIEQAKQRKNIDMKNLHGRRMINLQTKEIVVSKQELSRRYGISSDRVHYAAVNHKKILNEFCWQYIDQLVDLSDETLKHELIKYA